MAREAGLGWVHAKWTDETASVCADCTWIDVAGYTGSRDRVLDVPCQRHAPTFDWPARPFPPGDFRREVIDSPETGRWIRKERADRAVHLAEAAHRKAVEAEERLEAALDRAERLQGGPSRFGVTADEAGQALASVLIPPGPPRDPEVLPVVPRAAALTDQDKARCLDQARAELDLADTYRGILP